jgi:hypothetical protein
VDVLYRAQVAVVRAFNSLRDPGSGSDKRPWLGAAVDFRVFNLESDEDPYLCESQSGRQPIR